MVRDQKILSERLEPNTSVKVGRTNRNSRDVVPLSIPVDPDDRSHWELRRFEGDILFYSEVTRIFINTGPSRDR